MTGMIPLNSTTVLLAIASAALLTLALGLSLLVLRQRRRLEEQMREEQKVAFLSMFRESYEDRIADLNARLLATEERWRDVNHLLLDSQRSMPTDNMESKVDSRRFLQRLGIDAERVQVDPKLIFVLTPFSQREAATFKVVQQIAQRLGFRCVRGDEEYKREDILTHVVELLVRARIVIANISGRNPNVYYELGIAHALGKPTILVSRSLDNVPFDMRSKYIVLFQTQEELADRLRDAVTRLLAEVD